MAAVNLLKANWISVQEIFELVNRVLTRMFVGLWPKQKAEVPNNDLKKLAEAFNTTNDPVLQLKGLSLKRGAEGAIALSYAHGADFDWEKVTSWPHPLRAKGLLREDEKVCAYHSVDHFSFSGFCGFFYANFLDSIDG
jgi:hypothetical protein